MEPYGNLFIAGMGETIMNQLKACRGQIDKSELKLEVSSIYRIFRCNSMQNIRLLS